MTIFFLGMMRDCQKKYYSRDSVNDGGNRRCRNQTVKVRQHVLNAEYCFCLGSYCNGDGDSLNKSVNELRKTSKFTTIRNHQRNGTKIGWSLCSVQYLIFVYVVCLKLRLVSLLDIWVICDIVGYCCIVMWWFVTLMICGCLNRSWIHNMNRSWVSFIHWK